MSSTTLTVWDRADSLARRCADGDETVWPELMTEIEPRVSAMARMQPIGRLRAQPDVVRDIVVKVFEKISADKCRRLRALYSMAEPPSLRAWLRRLTRNVAIDVMRRHPEFRPASLTRSQPGWVSLTTLASSPAGDATTGSLAQMRRQVLTDVAQYVADIDQAIETHGDGAADVLARAWAVARMHAARMVRVRPIVNDVISGVIAGRSQKEISEALGASPREVGLALRYVEELLCIRYRSNPVTATPPCA